MATVNPSVWSAYNPGTQNFYYIQNNGVNLYSNPIVYVSQGDPAEITTSNPVTISETGTVGTIAGSGPWTATISNMSTTKGLQTGDIIVASAGSGSIGTGDVSITAITGPTRVTIKAVGGSAPTAGTVAGIGMFASLPVPAGLVSGDAILVTGVQGMVELETAGENGTNLFYANIAGPDSIQLYKNAALSTTVDSTGFTAADENTGQFNTFTVPYYDSYGSIITMLFPEIRSAIGTDIDIDLDTGVITLQQDITYQFTVTAQAQSNAASQNGYFILYDELAEATIGVPTPFGETFVTTITPGAETTYRVICVNSSGAKWLPPAGILLSTIVVTAVSGFEQ